MTKGRYGLTLVVAGDDLYAVSGDAYEEEYKLTLTIEKLSKVSGAWEMVTTFEGVRSRCSAAVVGSKIYVFGGRYERVAHTWNAFDVINGEWASASMPFENRMLPRDDFSEGQMISVPSCLDNGKRMTWDD